jgi:hypothetical protein
MYTSFLAEGVGHITMQARLYYSGSIDADASYTFSSINGELDMIEILFEERS